MLSQSTASGQSILGGFPVALRYSRVATQNRRYGLRPGVQRTLIRLPLLKSCASRRNPIRAPGTVRCSRPGKDAASERRRTIESSPAFPGLLFTVILTEVAVIVVEGLSAVEKLPGPTIGVQWPSVDLQVR
jgi:hypothetical protein